MTGTRGPIGLTGIINYAEFYDLSTVGDVSIPIGSNVPFSLNASTNNVIIRNTSNSTSEFVLPNIATYNVNYSVPTSTNSGQLAIKLNTSILNYTVTGSAISEGRQGTFLITTTSANQKISVSNVGPSAYVIPNTAGGGALPISRNLLILQITN